MIVYVESAGGSVYYDTIGDGRDWMLLVHGANCDAEFMGPLATQLPEFTCIVLDRLGYRRSGRLSRDTSVEEQARAIQAVHEACTSAPTWLFGHSSGGNFALAYALLNPTAVRGLILMEPALYAAYSRKDAPPAIAEMTDYILPIFRRGDIGAGLEAWVRVLGGATDTTFAALKELGLSDRLLENAEALAHDQPPVIEWCPTDDELQSLKLPILLLEGTESPELLRGIVRILAPKLRAKTTRLQGCDHMAPQVAAQSTAAAIRVFTQGGT
jgi:pimeloyl-ACP methyl ester carboxylesterase